MVSEEFERELDAYLDEHWDDMVEDLASLVRVRSVEDMEQAASGAPYGPGPAQGLEAALALTERLGFRSQNLEGYIGTADIPGESDRQIGVICHSDVVPEGDGWHYPPFDVTRKDGYLIGRGTVDDKGPLVVALHAAKFLRERGTAFPYTLRFLVGANEETGMRDLEYYLARYQEPMVTISPDEDFPLCFGEKGHVRGYFESAPIEDGVVRSLQGGLAYNAVAGAATAVLDADPSLFQATERVSVEPTEEGGTRLVARGVQVHAAFPEGGVNAIHELAKVVLASNACAEAERSWFEFMDVLLGVTDGSGIGLACSDDMFGALTCVGGMARMVEGKLGQTIDIRCPAAISEDEVVAALERAAKQAGATWHTTKISPRFFQDPNGMFVRTLVSAYRDITGDMQEPYTVGGRTYASHFTHAVAFGAGVHGAQHPSWVGPMHGADEGASEANLKQAFKVYALAIERLMQVDWVAEYPDLAR